MNTIDLIKKVSDTNNLTTGRAEMIISIIFERIKEKMKKEGGVHVEGFGEFTIFSKQSASGGIFTKNYIAFNTDKTFLDHINS